MWLDGPISGKVLGRLGVRLARFRLIPKEEKFYEDFQAMAAEVQRGAALLVEMLAPDRPAWDKAREIKDIEHRCDLITHQIIERLNRTFVTPIDREDIHGLAHSLDDVMDAIDACATVVSLYRIERVRPGTRELAAILKEAAEKLVAATKEFEGLKALSPIADELTRLEKESDRVYQQAIVQLFADERDPIALIKSKEMLEFLEAATDRCEDVANVFEAIVVKHL
jgi:predicted phosphate transport protein (TIGR00153 family)